MDQSMLDHDRLQKMLWSFASQRVITVAARTGILQQLAEQPASAEALATKLELSPLPTTKMLRALTALGLLEADRESCYRVVESLVPLLGSGPDSILPMAENLHSLYERWGATLEPWIRGEPQPLRKPPDPQKFGEAMQAMGQIIAKQIPSVIDINNSRRMLDIGGGFGHYAKAFCRVNDNLSAVVLDRPEVTTLGEASIINTDMEGRIFFKGGNYLEMDWGDGFDLVLLANVLHQENAASAASMVKRAAEAITGRGRIVVVDFSIDEKQQKNLFGALFSINMRSFGDTYPESTIRQWMKSAGLSDIQRTDLNDYRWIIVGRKGL